MDCKTARLLLPFAGPAAGELDADEAQALRAHLDSCPECRDLADAERRLDAHLGRAVRDVAVPERLRGAILTRAGAERDAFIRGLLFRLAGVVAVVALVTVAGLLYLNRRPTLTLKEVVDSAEPARDAAKADEWLREVDPSLPAGKDRGPAPPNFDYRNQHTGQGLANIDGRRVPYLTFAHATQGPQPTVAWARVYVLSERRFDLEELRQANGSGVGVQAEVLPQTVPGVVHVAVFTGDDLQSFYKPEPPPPPVR